MADVNVSVSLPNLTSPRVLTENEKDRVKDQSKEPIKQFLENWLDGVTVSPGEVKSFTVDVTLGSV